jgi:hypothetical protein
VILASKLENFEEYAYTACELILRGDRRIGRVTRGGRGTAEAEGEGETGEWESGEWESRGGAPRALTPRRRKE